MELPFCSQKPNNRSNLVLHRLSQYSNHFEYVTDKKMLFMYKCFCKTLSPIGGSSMLIYIISYIQNMFNMISTVFYSKIHYNSVLYENSNNVSLGALFRIHMELKLDTAATCQSRWYFISSRNLTFWFVLLVLYQTKETKLGTLKYDVVQRDKLLACKQLP